MKPRQWLRLLYLLTFINMIVCFIGLYITFSVGPFERLSIGGIVIMIIGFMAFIAIFILGLKFSVCPDCERQLHISLVYSNTQYCTYCGNWIE